MGIVNKLFYINNNKILYDKITKYKYTYDFSEKIIYRIVNKYIEFNRHKLNILTTTEILEDIISMIKNNYTIIDEQSVNKLIIFSIVNNPEYLLFYHKLYQKFIFLLHNNCN